MNGSSKVNTVSIHTGTVISWPISVFVSNNFHSLHLFKIYLKTKVIHLVSLSLLWKHHALHTDLWLAPKLLLLIPWSDDTVLKLELWQKRSARPSVDEGSYHCLPVLENLPSHFEWGIKWAEWNPSWYKPKKIHSWYCV